MMAETDHHHHHQGLEGDQQGSAATTTSFSQLLFGGDDDDELVGLELGQSTFNYACSSSSFTTTTHDKSTPKMLCFGGHAHAHQTHNADLVFGESAAPITTTTTTTKAAATPTPQRSGITCSDSSSASSGGNNIKSVNPPTSNSKSTRKRNGGRESVQNAAATSATAQPATQRSNKKSKADTPAASTGHAKVRKEKLGDRITALQQLVSPFGKTDTASVLHEAMGYIRFLHDQVQVLCSPYLQVQLQQQQHIADGGENGGGEEESIRKDLKSRGLCLVPVACTLHVANSNGADFWSPAMGNKTM